MPSLVAWKLKTVALEAWDRITPQGEPTGSYTKTLQGPNELRELVMDREPGVLRFRGSQRVRHDWATELNWKSWQSTILWLNPKVKAFPLITTLLINISFKMPWDYILVTGYSISSIDSCMYKKCSCKFEDSITDSQRGFIFLLFCPNFRHSN